MFAIFLDFDGVLNTPHTWGKRPPVNAIEDDKVVRLHEFVKETNASVVISSTWRHLFEWDELIGFLNRRGWPYEDKHLFIGKTPVIDLYARHHTGTRGKEIQIFLNGNPEITNYIIFDDNDDFLPHQQRHFIQTDYKHGLTAENIEDARKKKALVEIFLWNKTLKEISK